MSDAFNKLRTGTGTKEWAEHNVNIGRGCSHNCLYCYAKERALRFKTILGPSEWPSEHINPKAVAARRGKKDGVIMFPTTHDITPYYLESSITVLEKLLSSGNKVLIVSKPHLDCIVQLCERLDGFKDNILFRFTIGSLDPEICQAWEPGAPNPFERLAALSHAYNNRFNTSVSMEPFLDNVVNTIRDFKVMATYVTDKIWVGKMNKLERRIDMSLPENQALVQQIKTNQTDTEIMYLFKKLKNHPKIEWKDSIKSVVNM